VVTEYLDYLGDLGELPVYILVVLALHGSQVAMVWPLPVPGDLHINRVSFKFSCLSGKNLYLKQHQAVETKTPVGNAALCL
jgi:hypothetical protein